MGYYYSGFPRYVSVGQKSAKAQRQLEKLKKKNPDIAPLVLKGNTIACTWWGKAWNMNLERYADFSNRIGRGRSYIRNGFVLDLKIKQGEITSLVQGTQLDPYKIVIKIDPLGKEACKKIKKQCEGKIESLQELIEGTFPQDLSEIFTAEGKGLFPAPKEIKLNCNCPDWASMCKHVAATLLGVGARLDDDPKLFFLLRKIEINDFITEAVRAKIKNLLKKSKKKTSRVIDDSDAEKMFGIDIDEKVIAPKPSASPKKAKRKTKINAKRKSLARTRI